MSDNEVRRCNRILAGTTEATNILLTEENIDRAVNQALQIIGEILNTDRVGAIENWHNPAKPDFPHWRLIYEWHSEGTISQISHPELTQGSYEGIEEWYALHGKGIGISCKLAQMPEPFRSGQAKLGVKVLHAIPIFVGGKHWGVIGIDDCHREIERSEAELSILKTIAACIGGAIERERTRLAQKEAERHILLERERAAIAKARQLSEYNRILSKRDRILAATAEAASILLAGEDIERSVNRALKIIGENIDTDRIAIVENFNHSADSQYLYWKITYEWDSEGIISQISHPELFQGSYEGIEEWYELFSQGKTVSCQLEDMLEPFRSKMARLGVRTLSSVPIFIEGQYWGNLGIDDCQKATNRSEAELNILKTTAACIGGAIERERTRRAKEEAERNILLEREKAAIQKAVQLKESNRVLSLCDKWLEATAKAANKLLEIADLDEGIDTALKVLGENLDCDRVEVMQFVPNRTDIASGSMQQLYKWNSPTVARQLSFNRLKHIANLSMDRYIAKMRAGEWIGGLIEEYPEPCGNEEIELGVKSTYAVSISVDNQFWGILAIDYCRQAKRLILPEIAVFKTAASCIGSAIYRQKIQQEKETAELAILEERNRMAREIHDTLAQAFTGISLQLEAAKSSLDTESKIVLERLLQAQNLAKEGIVEARRSVLALRSEALKFGLVAALQQTLAKLLLGTNIKAKTVFELGTKTFTPAIEVGLFRIAQEAITNAIRHAQATEIELQLICESNTVYLQIKDNGIGFNPEKLQDKGFGLLGMQERCDRLNGHLNLLSEIGRGTEITVAIANLT